MDSVALLDDLFADTGHRHLRDIPLEELWAEHVACQYEPRDKSSEDVVPHVRSQIYLKQVPYMLHTADGGSSALPIEDLFNIEGYYSLNDKDDAAGFRHNGHPRDVKACAVNSTEVKILDEGSHFLI